MKKRLEFTETTLNYNNISVVIFKSLLTDMFVVTPCLRCTFKQLRFEGSVCPHSSPYHSDSTGIMTPHVLGCIHTKFSVANKAQHFPFIFNETPCGTAVTVSDCFRPQTCETSEA